MPGGCDVDVTDTAGSPADDGPDGAEVVWLFDPAAGPGRFEGTPMELFERLSVAAAHASVVEVAVRGVVVGVRRRGRVCTIVLADQAPGAAAPEPLVRVVVFAEALRRIDQALIADGVELVEGAEVTAVGTLRFDPPWGGFRVVATDIDVHTESGAVAAARAELVHALAAEGLLGRQAALVVPGRPLRVGWSRGRGRRALRTWPRCWRRRGWSGSWCVGRCRWPVRMHRWPSLPRSPVCPGRSRT
jgi:hypothetical protein